VCGSTSWAEVSFILILLRTHQCAESIEPGESRGSFAASGANLAIRLAHTRAAFL
jgi:hypothetical protein